MISEQQSSISSEQNLDTEERIRLPSGAWIFKDKFTGKSRRTSELEDEN